MGWAWMFLQNTLVTLVLLICNKFRASKGHMYRDMACRQAQACPARYKLHSSLFRHSTTQSWLCHFCPAPWVYLHTSVWTHPKENKIGTETVHFSQNSNNCLFTSYYTVALVVKRGILLQHINFFLQGITDWLPQTRTSLAFLSNSEDTD